jgi:hypothetical protein
MGRNSGNATAYLNNLVEWMISNVAGGGGAAKNNTSSLSSTASSSGADRLTNFVSGLGRQISALSTLSTIASPIEM